LDAAESHHTVIVKVTDGVLVSILVDTRHVPFVFNKIRKYKHNKLKHLLL